MEIRFRHYHSQCSDVIWTWNNRDCMAIPMVGHMVSLGSHTYTVHQVLWEGSKTVTIYVV